MTEDREDPAVAAWRGLLVAHSRLVRPWKPTCGRLAR